MENDSSVRNMEPPSSDLPKKEERRWDTLAGRKLRAVDEVGVGGGLFKQRTLTGTSGFLCWREIVCLLYKALPVPAPGPVGTVGSLHRVSGLIGRQCVCMLRCFSPVQLVVTI